MRLEQLKALDDEAARREMLRCGGSTAWAARMAAARPFSSVDRVLDTADRFWNDCGPSDWLEAFAAHPKIGEGRAGQAGQAGENMEWSAQEQSGTRGTSEDVRERLARGNRDYEA